MDIVPSLRLPPACGRRLHSWTCLSNKCGSVHTRRSFPAGKAMDRAVLRSAAMRTAFVTPRVEWPPRGDHFADDDEPTAKQPEYLRLLALTLTNEAEVDEESIEPPPMSGIRRSSFELLDPPLRVAPPEPSPPSARSAQVDLPVVVRKDVEIVDAKVANAPPPSRAMF